MSELERKTFVFDLDGTICVQTKGGDEYQDPAPMPLVVDCVRRLHALGHRIVIHTARGMSSYDATPVVARALYEHWTKDWLSRHDVPYDELIFGKPAGDYYIDDKGMSIGYLIEMLGVT